MSDKPAPTPLSELNRLAARQRKYHPARPYRWWEYKPMQAEAPEVFYPVVDEEEYRAGSEYLLSRGKRFWPNVGVGVLLALWFGGLAFCFWLVGFGIQLLFGGL